MKTAFDPYEAEIRDKAATGMSWERIADYLAEQHGIYNEVTNLRKFAKNHGITKAAAPKSWPNMENKPKKRRKRDGVSNDYRGNSRSE